MHASPFGGNDMAKAEKEYVPQKEFSMIARTIYKCDICKKEFPIDAENQEMGNISVEYTLKSASDKYEEQATNPLDLCPDCTRKLKMFLANKL